jgi:flagellar basal body-associated protein FliL
MKKKIMILLPVLLLGGGYVAYGKFLKKPPPPPKIAGTVYVLPKQFTLNMADGRYATLTVALVLDPKEIIPASAEGGATPPDGYGNLPEEAVIRDIVTNVVTNEPGKMLTTEPGRETIKTEILNQIKQSTDVKIDEVLLPDVAVQ